MSAPAEDRAGVVRRLGGFAQEVVRHLRDVRAEVRKVTWPTWADLRRTTVIIIVFVIVIGAIIGIMDVVSSWVLIDLLGRIFR